MRYEPTGILSERQRFDPAGSILTWISSLISWCQTHIISINFSPARRQSISLYFSVCNWREAVFAAGSALFPARSLRGAGVVAKLQWRPVRCLLWSTLVELFFFVADGIDIFRPHSWYRFRRGGLRIMRESIFPVSPFEGATLRQVSGTMASCWSVADLIDARATLAGGFKFYTRTGFYTGGFLTRFPRYLPQPPQHLSKVSMPTELSYSREY